MSQLVRFILILMTLLVGLAFHLRNNEPVTLDYYINTIESPMSLIIVLTLIIGVLLGISISLPIVVRLKKRVFKLEKQAKNIAQK